MKFFVPAITSDKTSDYSNTNTHKKRNAKLRLQFVWQIRLIREEIEIGLAFSIEREGDIKNAHNKCLYSLRYASVQMCSLNEHQTIRCHFINANRIYYLIQFTVRMLIFFHLPLAPHSHSPWKLRWNEILNDDVNNTDAAYVRWLCLHNWRFSLSGKKRLSQINHGIKFCVLIFVVEKWMHEMHRERVEWVWG